MARSADQGSDTNGGPIGHHGVEDPVEPMADAQAHDEDYRPVAETSEQPDAPVAEDVAETGVPSDVVIVPRSEWEEMQAELKRLAALAHEHENFRILFEDRLHLVQARVDVLTRREAAEPGQQQSGSRLAVSIPPPKILEVNGDPYAWVGDMEAYFRVTRVADADMVPFALTRMNHQVRQSWLNSEEHSRQPTSWYSLSVYIRSTSRTKMSDTELTARLAKLRQGDTSIHEYIRAFEELMMQFTTPLADEKLAEFFLTGLSKKIYEVVMIVETGQKPTTYARAKHLARTMAISLLQSREGEAPPAHASPRHVEHEGRNNGPRPAQSMRHRKAFHGKHAKGKEPATEAGPKDPEKRRTPGACFICGSTEHRQAECPRKKHKKDDGAGPSSRPNQGNGKRR